MKSTPVSPARIIVLSALPPPPPTPTTLILAPSSFVTSSMSPPLLFAASRTSPDQVGKQKSEKLLEEPEHPLADRRSVDREGTPFPRLLEPVKEQPHRGGMRRARHHVCEPAHIARHSPADGKAEDLLGELGHSRELGRAASQHHARGEQVLLARLLDLAMHELEQLLHPRLDDLAEDPPGEHPRRAAADARHLDGLVPLEDLRLGRPVLDLDPLGLVHRSAQADRDVVRQVVPAEGYHARVLDGAVHEDGEIGGAASHVDEGHPELLLLLREDRFRGGERLEDDVRDGEPRPGAALDDVLRARDGSGDDMHLRLQAHPAHPQGLLDPVLVVDDEFLREDVDDLAILRDVDPPGGVDHPRHVGRTDLLVLHRHDALRVESADMSAGDARVDGADLASRHQLRFLDGPLDGGDGRLDVDDHSLAQPARGMLADADHVEARLLRLSDEAADLRGPDVEPDHELAPLLSHDYRASVCCGLRPPPVAGRARSSVAASCAEAQSGRAGLSRSMRTARSPRTARAARTFTSRRSFIRRSRSPKRISWTLVPSREKAVSPASSSTRTWAREAGASPSSRQASTSCRAR